MSGPARLLLTLDAVGGVWQYALDLAHALRPLGIEPVLALLGPAPSDEQRAAAAGLRLIETGLPLDWLAPNEQTVRASARAIADLARRERVELIQLNQPALAAEPMPVPVVTVVHSCVATWWAAAGRGPLPDSFAWQTALVRAGLVRASAIVCPSAAFADAVQVAYALPAAPQVVHNGRRAHSLAEASRRDAAFTAGRLWDRGKNVATLDRAAALLAVPFDVAGPLVSPTGERVTLTHAHALGTLSDAAVAERLAERPVFVSAALYEPFGLAVLEAAQAGCALVLADTPVFRELWDGAAIFVAPTDAAGFAAAVDALIADPARRSAHGEHARVRAAGFTPAAMAGGMAARYRDVLGRRAAA